MQIIEGSSIPWAFDESRGAPPGHLRGKHCFVLDEGEALEAAKRALGREGQEELCLKVFFIRLAVEVGEQLEDWYWGRPRPGLSLREALAGGHISRLGEAATVQNLCWMGGLAPRVYGLLAVARAGKLFPAQLTEHIPGPEPDAETVARLKGEVAVWAGLFGAKLSWMKLLGPRDFPDGKLIDWQGFRLENNEMIAAFVREHGRYGKAHYQSVPALGLGARPRDTDRRIEAMRLGEVDFEGKRVLDVGCSLGAFCNYAAERGARRVVGLDNAETVQAAYAVAFALGNHNNDYRAVDLLEDGLEEDFDITFFLSMNMHVGLPEWVMECTRELLIFEENARGSRFDTDRWITRLSEHFDVEQIGHTTDHNPAHPKPVLWCRKR